MDLRFLQALPIIGKIFDWIEEWKRNTALRRARKLSKIKEELAIVETRLEYYANTYKSHSEYLDYVKLLKSKRVLEKRIAAMAR